MRMGMRIKSLLLSAVLVLTTVTPVQASIRFYQEGKENGESQLAQVLSETVSELEDMTPGEDYDTDSAFIVADSREEAEKAAALYDAELIDFNYGIATLALKKDIREVLKETEAKIDSMEESGEKSYILYPQTRVHLYGGKKRAVPETNDPKIGEQWFHDKLDTAKAWETAKGKGALVVVIDGGVRASHNDLKKNISGNEAILSSSERRRGGRSSVNAYGWPNDTGESGGSEGSGSSGNYEDNDMSDGHGTHVCGLVAADENNGICGAGVAPDAGIYMIKVVTSSGSGNEEEEECNFSDITSAINRAVALNAHVINLSLGVAEGDITTSEVQLWQDAVDKAYAAGITVVAASGNDGSSGKDYPGCLNHVINVGAISKSDKLSDFSNYGEYVDLCAPGEGILSTVTSSADAMESMDGTSMASPIVAGVAALVYSANPALLNGHDSATADNVANIMLNSTDNAEYKYESHIVNGCIDAAKAVEKSANGDFSGYESVSGNGLVFKEKQTGYLTSSARNALNPIALGKSLKLQICNENGMPVEEAKKKRNVKWSLSNTTDFTIKNGKLKCQKTASVGSETYVYAEFGNKKVSARFVAVRETLTVGCYDYNSGKFRNKLTLESGFSTGQTIAVNNCSVLASTDVLAYYIKPSSTGGYGYGGDGYYPGDGGYYPGDGGGYYPGDGGYYPGDGGYYPGDGGWWWYSLRGSESESADTGYVNAIDAGYAIKISNSKNLGEIEKDKNGNIISFVPKKRGTYTVTYTMIDGGNKKFKIKIKVQ